MIKDKYKHEDKDIWYVNQALICLVLCGILAQWFGKFIALIFNSLNNN